MTILLIILKSLILAKLLTEFTPLQWVLDLLPENIFKWIIQVLTSCLKCATTWIALILTGDVYIAGLAHIVANIYHSIEKIIKNIWVKLEKKSLQ